MKRIKLVLAVGAVMVAMLALNAGSAMADEIEEFEIDGNEVEIELVGGGDLEFDADDVDVEDVFGFDVLDIDDDDNDIFDDDDDDDIFDDDDEQEVIRVLDIG
jgi:hypothetical protein